MTSIDDAIDVLQDSFSKAESNWLRLTVDGYPYYIQLSQNCLEDGAFERYHSSRRELCRDIIRVINNKDFLIEELDDSRPFVGPETRSIESANMLRLIDDLTDMMPIRLSWCSWW